MEFLIIENNIDRAKAFDEMGINYIFLDLEIMGKVERQGHLNTVISKHHQMTDVDLLKKHLTRSKLLVRCNPIHHGSKAEIDEIIDRGADVIMLPFFKSHFEVEKFIGYVNGRVRTILLLETPQAYCRIDRIIKVKGIDAIHIGLNDLHLGMGLSFMFELLSNGVVDHIVEKLKAAGIKYGIGGIAGLEGGLVSGADVLKEHVRLGSSMVILSRAMTNSFKDNIAGIKNEVDNLIAFENLLKTKKQTYFTQAHVEFCEKIDCIVDAKIN